MKFVMYVRPDNQSAPWREAYDFPYVKTMHDAVCSATAQIADWNQRGLSKRGRRHGMIERTRQLVAVEFGGERREMA